MNRILQRILYKQANNELVLKFIYKFLEANADKLHININLFKLKNIPNLNKLSIDNIIDKYYEYIIIPEYYKLIKQKLLSISTISIYKFLKINGSKAKILQNDIKKYVTNNCDLIIKDYYNKKYSKADLENILNTVKSSKDLNKKINNAIINIIKVNPIELGFPILDENDLPNDTNAITYAKFISENENEKNNIINNIIMRLETKYNNLIDKLKKIYNTKYTNYILILLQKHFNKCAQIAYLCLYPDKKEIEYLINKSNKNWNHLCNLILKAYNNVKIWLKEDYPELELEELDKDDIYIDPSFTGTSIDAACSSEIKNNIVHAYILLNRKLLNNNINDTFFISLIYHELIHAIKNQAKKAQDLYYLRENTINPATINQYQQWAHNDDIWYKGTDMIAKHTHLNIDNNYSPTLSYANSQLHKLDQPHEASLICYNCGWFNVYPKWNNDCEEALNGTFICPTCHKNDVKLIYPDAGEKQLINDALTHLHYQSVEKKEYKPDESRLKIKNQWETELQRLNKN